MEFIVRSLEQMPELALIGCVPPSLGGSPVQLWPLQPRGDHLVGMCDNPIAEEAHNLELVGDWAGF